MARGFARTVCAHARDTQQLTERTRQLAVSLAEQSSKVAVNVNTDAMLKELSAVLAIVDPPHFRLLVSSSSPALQ
ncbi:hypothetical protein DIPPA_28301 [Diplonema papillatum]|nr:hypothetical protein DIPPA_28301 [Diplonema papillatum]